MRGSWHGPARTCVRRGDTDAWPSIPSAPRLGLARSALAKQGVVQHCDPAAVNGVQCSAGGPLRRTHRVIACFADRSGAVASAAEYVSSFVAAQAGRQAGIGRVRRSSDVVPRRWGTWVGGGRLVLGHELLAGVGGFEQAPESERFGFSSVLLLLGAN
jgi:hypothetical protein